MELAARHVPADRDALDEAERPGIEPFVHAHHANARLLIAGHDGALDRRRAAPARQERGMEVEAAERGKLEDRFRQYQAIGDDDRDIGRMAEKTLRRLFVAKGLRRQHLDAEPLRRELDGRRPFRHATAGRTRRARIGGDDLMARPDDGGERRNGKLRRAHEDDSQRVLLGIRLGRVKALPTTSLLAFRALLRRAVK